MDNRPLTEINKKLIFEALEKFPEAGSRTIARYIFKNYPTLFLSVDRTRDIVRYYRGQRGNWNRRYLKDRTHVRKSV